MNKLILFKLCILFTSISWAQLKISDNTSLTTSLGSLLYVKGDLSVSSTGGDLIVKSNATTNSSLIVEGTMTGEITYKRHIKSANQWYIISSPVVNQSIPSFATETLNKVRKNTSNGNIAIGYYKNSNPATKKWVYHNVSPSPMAGNQETLVNFTSGAGYASSRSEAGDYTFKGAMEDSDVSITIPNAVSSGNLWAAVGNPYPSFINGNNNADSSSNVLKNNLTKLDPSFSALYLWDNTKYTPINNTSPSSKILPGQGFLVKAKTTNETFIFAESLQTHVSGTTVFLRNEDRTSKITLNLSNNKLNSKTNILFLDSATNGLDIGYDAGTYREDIPLFSLDTHLVSDSQGIDFAIQCLPKTILNDELLIPLSIRAATGETITFSLSESINFPSGVDLYLEDRFKNTFTNLKEKPYQLSLEESANGIGRFYIRNSTNSLDVEKVDVSTISIYKSKINTLRIVGLQEQGNAIIKMIDLTGKEVFINRFTSRAVNDILFPSNLSTGVYIVNIITSNKKYSKKLIIE